MTKEQFFEKINNTTLYMTEIANLAIDVVGDDEESKDIREYGQQLLEGYDGLFNILDENDVEINQ